MNTDVTFRHLKPTRALREFAQEKAERVKKYLEEPISAHLVLEVERDRHRAHVTVTAHGVSCQAKAATRDMYAAIDAVMDKIEKQLSRRKGRREHGAALVHHQGLERLAGPPRGKSRRKAAPGRSNGGPLQAEGLMGKPMSVEEALLQLERSREAFLVFRNDQSEEVNVVFRRKNGSFGLIDPDI